MADSDRNVSKNFGLLRAQYRATAAVGTQMLTRVQTRCKSVLPAGKDGLKAASPPTKTMLLA
jgi:phage/plasmid primase-like uncharacterized protein